jgi:hypothetical protein
VKSFNWAIAKRYNIPEYHTQLADGEDSSKYNHTLIERLNEVLDRYDKMDHKADPTTKLIPIKVDYLAERSLTDNIAEETSENTLVAVISYCLMFLYVGCALG